MTGGTPWWGTLLATAVTAAAALLGTWLASRRQDNRSENIIRSTGREEWFRRLQWAEELAATTDNDARRATGRAILNQLAGSHLATDEDVRLIRAMTDFSDVTSYASGVAADDSVEALGPALAATSADPVESLDVVGDTGINATTEEPS
jgi:hypothetical protein